MSMVMLQVLEGAFPSLGHDIVLQEKPTGFRDAVMAGLQSLPDSTADLLVIPGNLPLLTSQALAEVVQQGQRTALEKSRGLTQLCASGSNEPSGIFWAAAAFLREKLRDLPNGTLWLALISSV
jgi:molybdopterin-guanine dinucleotide biosynthesis protein A